MAVLIVISFILAILIFSPLSSVYLSGAVARGKVPPDKIAARALELLLHAPRVTTVGCFARLLSGCLTATGSSRNRECGLGRISLPRGSGTRLADADKLRTVFWRLF